MESETTETRFAFGQNWARFQKLLTEERIETAVSSLQELLPSRSLDGKTFLDIGSGSGLFSLAAKRLGAEVYSFDYDPESVGCTQKLKDQFYPNSADWQVSQASVLDRNYMESLPKVDVVYSWGVLHHTGDMWTALEHASLALREGGVLTVAIYNDQGVKSSMWKAIKRFYCANVFSRALCVMIFFPLFFLARIVIDLSECKNPLRSFLSYSESGRGMAVLTDWHDWLGGYPFEVAKPEEIVDFYRDCGFLLSKLRTVGGKHGCNEYVFIHVPSEKH